MHVCACAWACQGDMTVSSHMTNHVEQWEQRRGTESVEKCDLALKNLILLNMDAVFLKKM